MRKRQKVIHPAIFQRDLGLFVLSSICCTLVSLMMMLTDCSQEVSLSFLTIPLFSIIIYLCIIYRVGYEGSQIKSLIVLLFIWGVIDGGIFYETILHPEQSNFYPKEFDLSIYIMSTLVCGTLLHIFRILPWAIKNTRY